MSVPASIKINYGRVLPLSVYLLATFPNFVVAALACLRMRRPLDERERWVVSAVCVLFPASVWTICKSGGSDNSFLPAYLAMTALFVLTLPLISDWIASLPPGPGFAAALGLTLVMLFSFFAQRPRAFALLYARAGDENYPVAIEVARRAGPGTISPEAPTIAYRASGYFGRSLFFELDAHAVNGEWPGELPQALQEELARSSHVIAAPSFVPTPVFDRALERARFRPELIDALHGSASTLWTRETE